MNRDQLVKDLAGMPAFRWAIDHVAAGRAGFYYMPLGLGASFFTSTEEVLSLPSGSARYVIDGRKEDDSGIFVEVFDENKWSAVPPLSEG